MKASEEFLKELASESEDVVMLIRDAVKSITYYKRLLERLELDNLTGLPGNNKFRDYTQDIEKRTSSVSVIFFDVNNLKFYNDTKGHSSGDLLLQKAAESIHQICGRDVKAFRIGGDEFIAVITNCEENYTNEVLEKWKNGLDRLNSSDDDIHCSVAVGTAYGYGQYNFGDVLKLADERMYEAKRNMKAERYEG